MAQSKKYSRKVAKKTTYRDSSTGKYTQEPTTAKLERRKERSDDGTSSTGPGLKKPGKK